MRDKLLSIYINIDDTIETVGVIETARMVCFSGEAVSPFFKGIVCGSGVDTQREKRGLCELSARYTLEGHDLTGASCRIFVENTATADGKDLKTRPVIITDSKALCWLQFAKLEGEIVDLQGDNGAKHSEEIQADVLESRYTLRIDIFELLEEYSVNAQAIKIGNKSIYSELYLPVTTKVKMPLLIASHGFNSNTEGLKNELKHIAARGIACLSYDFCGGGNFTKSSGSTTQMSIASEQGDLRDVFEYASKLDFVDTKAIYLFGSSQGGFVTALTAPELEDKINGIFLEFPAFCIPDDWAERRMTIKEESFDFWGVKLGQSFLKGLPDYDVFEHANKYFGRVRIYHGTADSVVNERYAFRLNEGYKNSMLFLYPEQGHGFNENFLKAMSGDIAMNIRMNWLDWADMEDK